MPKFFHFIQVMAWNFAHNPQLIGFNLLDGFEFGICWVNGIRSFQVVIPLMSSGWYRVLEHQYLKTKNLSEAERIEWFDQPPF